MNVDPALLHPGLPWLLGVVLAPLLAASAWRADWHLLAERGRVHVYGVSLVCILALWQMRAGIGAAPQVHLVGATYLTLMFGWRLALLGLAGVSAASAVVSGSGLAGACVDALLFGAVPASLSWLLGRATVRWLPRNPFVFILVDGFLGAALVLAASGAISAAVLYLGSTLAPERLLDDYLMVFLLLPYAEGFVTGAVLAWLSMFYPDQVRAYREP